MGLILIDLHVQYASSPFSWMKRLHGRESDIVDTFFTTIVSYHGQCLEMLSVPFVGLNFGRRVTNLRGGASHWEG